MKRLFISLAMVLATIGMAWSQKSYVNVVADHIYSSIYQEIYLTGDVPVGIKTHYDSYGSEAMTVGKVLNLLAAEGFVVEQMSCSAECEAILLSRVQVFPPDSDAIQRVDADDQDVHEVARYNLAGRPCSPSDKGVQIIVYSDFTTRTVVED